MPHDIKGRKIDEGDVVVGKHWIHGGKPVACVVLGVCEGSTTCNVNAQSVKAPMAAPQSMNASEVEILLKHDGSKPAEA